jgi:hypothetical protein
VTDPVPTTKLRAPKATAKSKALEVLKGTAADDKGVARVEITIVRLKGSKCSTLTAKGTFRASRTCTPTKFFKASGKQVWSYELKKPLPKGVYAVYVRAVDSAGQVSKVVKRALKVT